MRIFATPESDMFVSYMRVHETSVGVLKLIYPSLGMIIFGDVTIGQ